MRSQRGAEQVDQPLRDHHGAAFVKGAVVAEAGEEKLQRLALHQPFAGDVVDHDMGEIRLAGHRAERGELRRREADDVILPLGRGGHSLQYRILGPVGGTCLMAELGQAWIGYVAHLKSPSAQAARTAAL